MTNLNGLDWMHLVHDAVIVREPSGKVIQWNRAAEERYGYSAEEAAGRPVEELLDRSFCDDGFADALARDGFWQGEVRVRSRDGRRLAAPCRQMVRNASEIVEVHGPVTSRTAADLRLVIDHLPGLVSYIDSDLRYRLANRAYTEWFGKSQAEVIGSSVEEVLGSELYGRVLPYMRRALSGELTQFANFLPNVGDKGKHVSVTYVPDVDAETSAVRGFVVLVEDDTARHQTEQSLRSSEGWYRQIVESVHEGIWLIGPDARTLFANQRMADLLGTTVDSLLDGHSFRYVFEDDVPRAQELFAKKMNGDREPFDIRLRRADGTALWTRISGVPMPDGQGHAVGLLGMFTDITEARAAEQALRDSEERFRTLLANMPDIVSRFDRAGRFIYVSPAVERATGLPPEAYVGRSHSEAGIPEPLASHLSERLEQIVHSGSPATVDFEMSVPGGETRDYHGLGVPEFAPDGSVRTVLTIVHDVTDQRRADEALRRSNAELEQFAYAAAHDLQEPLRVVATYTELFLRRYASTSDEGAQHLGVYIQNGVRQLQALVRDLLAYSRAVHEEPAPLEPFSLDDALDQAIAALGDAVTESGARIMRESLPVAVGNRGQFAQVFQNLLSNAVKYRHAEEPPSIRISAERSSSHWIVSVRDEGIGFNPVYAERIFGLFKRLHREAYPGTGVGLGICRRIVERHGGHIWAVSAGEGCGATFCFTVGAAH